MGRRIFTCVSVIFLLGYVVMSSGSLCYAALFKSEARTETTSAGSKTVKPVKKTLSPEALEAERTALMDAAQKTLKEKEWTIYISPRDGRGTVETDLLTFTDETVTSKNLEAKGYPTSNFGMLVQDNAAVSWETMKTAATKDKAFLRGDLKRDGSMTGVIFMKPLKGNTATYIFSTVSPDLTATASTAAQETAATAGKKGKK